MSTLILPEQPKLHRLIRYDPASGKLYWRLRGIDMFPNAKSPDITSRLWNARNANNEALCTLNADGYLFGSLLGRPRLAHRIIWRMITGEEPVQIDHINGDRTDNRFHNLRAVEGPENQRNMAIPITNKSGTMGVHWSDERQRWCATIRINGKRTALGRFKTLDEAVRVRKAAERAYGFHPNHGRAKT